MMIMETATFIFKFANIGTKKSSFKALKKFLIDNKWINQDGYCIDPLNSYHSTTIGECEVILADKSNSEEFSDLINEMFESFVSNDSIAWVKTIYNQNTSKIVINEADKYLKYQIKELSDIKEGDEVIVLLKRCND